jgi:hypothetical protein
MVTISTSSDLNQSMLKGSGLNLCSCSSLLTLRGAIATIIISRNPQMHSLYIMRTLKHIVLGVGKTFHIDGRLYTWLYTVLHEKNIWESKDQVSKLFDDNIHNGLSTYHHII